MDAFKEIEAEVLVESFEDGLISEDIFIKEMKALGISMREISLHLAYANGSEDDLDTEELEY